VWYGAFSVSQPSQGGALRSQLRLARATGKKPLLSYEQTVPGRPWNQVSIPSSLLRKDREFREQQELLTQAAQQTDQLSEVLYKNGGAELPEVLTMKRITFQRNSI